jgi:ABC-type dipeptide/oligopeptide/nickel transport system permease component
MSMLGYAARRLLGLVPVLAIAVVVTFVALQLVPGDPILIMLGDQSGDPALEARLRQEYGLDRPLAERFAQYLGGLVRGDFGLSFRFAETPVADVVSSGLAVSPLLATGALLLAFPLGVGLGTFSARRKGRWSDSAAMLLAVVGISIPNFAMAALLVYLLAVRFRALPVAGWGEPAQVVLPMVLLVIPPAVYIARLTRTYMVEVLAQDYVRTARAKGLGKNLVVYRHALRNALVPLLTSIGVIFGGLLSGTFVIETIFNIPGLGRLAIQSIFARDYPVVMAIVLLYTAFYSLVNLLVDLAYGLIDPRIRLDAGSAREL